MKTILLIALLTFSFPGVGNAGDDDALFRYINSVAITAFPKGTKNYDMYYVGPDSVGNSPELPNLLAKAKEERARWVVASLDAIVVKAVLMELFDGAESSEDIQTEIVVVSPITNDDELITAGRVVGVGVEFLYLKGVVDPVETAR